MCLIAYLLPDVLFCVWSLSFVFSSALLDQIHVAALIEEATPPSRKTGNPLPNQNMVVPPLNQDTVVMSALTPVALLIPAGDAEVKLPQEDPYATFVFPKPPKKEEIRINILNPWWKGL